MNQRCDDERLELLTSHHITPEPLLDGVVFYLG